MILTDLELREFRNYQEARVAFDKRITLILGANGAGKSNLVDAIYLLSYGRVLRGKDREAVRWGQDNALVAGHFTFSTGTRSVVRVSLSREGKRITVDGQPFRSRAELIGRFPVIISSAQDLWVVGGDPQGRRRFVDGVVALRDPSYIATLREFTKVLRQRNHLLNAARDGVVATTRGVLHAWTERFVEVGTAVSYRRWRSVQELQKWFGEYYRKLVGVDVRAELQYGPYTAQQVDESNLRERLRRKLAERAGLELKRGMTLAGPQLEDLTIRISGVDIRKYGSRGQAKCAAVALRLAQAKLLQERTAELAVLVMDDAFSDLDDEKALRVLDLTQEHQMVLTSAEKVRAQTIVRTSGTDALILEVRDGKVEAAE